MKISPPRPLILIILDGFGHREDAQANAIQAARKPNWDYFWENYTHTLISGSGKSVGLPTGQMGNSEVGHLNMGAGRIVYQDLTRIDLAIENGEFFNNKILLDAFHQAKKSGKAIHVFGLLSPGGVHSHEKHIHALLDLAAKINASPLFIHAFLDGRDTPPQSAHASLAALERRCAALKCGKIASLIGRYYAMDRDKRWNRIRHCYDLLTLGISERSAESALAGLQMAYDCGEKDEFVKATAIHEKHHSPVVINEDDSVIFMNFRADRARELTQAFIDPHFDGFVREKWPKLGGFICLSEYNPRFPAYVAFPPIPLENIFAEYISRSHLKQLRIAETEKYAHVTFFFNGGVETPYPGEDRILIPSPHVATYDLQPEMSAYELTDRLTEEIKKHQYDVIICNFANPDMVGHTGNFEATIKAIETVDECLGKIVTAAKQVGGEVLITADHGNAEKMYDPQTEQAHTAHTSEPVPFLYIGRKASIINAQGKLSDIAPTLLYLLKLPKPKEMTGEPLLRLIESE